MTTVLSLLSVASFEAFKRATALLCIVLTLFLLALPSCSTIRGFFSSVPSTSQVTADTSGVVSATRIAVSLVGPSALTTLNTYILAVHTAAATLAQGVQTGTSALPSPSQIQAFLQNIANQFGDAVWMQNLIGNLVTEYTKFYNVISKDEPTAYAYLTAFVNGTV